MPKASLSLWEFYISITARYTLSIEMHTIRICWLLQGAFSSHKKARDRSLLILLSLERPLELIYQAHLIPRRRTLVSLIICATSLQRTPLWIKWVFMAAWASGYLITLHRYMDGRRRREITGTDQIQIQKSLLI